MNARDKSAATIRIMQLGIVRMATAMFLIDVDSIIDETIAALKVIKKGD